MSGKDPKAPGGAMESTTREALLIHLGMLRGAQARPDVCPALAKLLGGMISDIERLLGLEDEDG